MKSRSVQFRSTIGILSHLPGMRYLEIPAAVVKKLGGKYSLRVICSVGTKVKFQAGLMALGGGKAYISLTRARMKTLGVREGDRVSVKLEVDPSEFGMEMPEELKVLLEQDNEGRQRFEGLTPGKKRYILHYVGAVKNPDLRLERALLLITNLKRAPQGKETFRQMLGIWD